MAGDRWAIHGLEDQRGGLAALMERAPGSRRRYPSGVIAGTCGVSSGERPAPR